jgi:hypothetical protein
MHLPTGSLGVYTLLGFCSKRDKGFEKGQKASRLLQLRYYGKLVNIFQCTQNHQCSSIAAHFVFHF